MDNRVYYGQYSLRHWLDLILKGNIVLPDYQRFFVWKKEKVETLITTFKDKQFVPPITIGAFQNGPDKVNYILDGQQRLTSILLAYLGLYPDQQHYQSTVERLNNENDDEIEEDEEQLDQILDWNFNKLTNKGKSKEEIHNKIKPGNYLHTDFGIDEAFLKNTFLGFSYLVPQIDSPQVQQRYYSSVFRNINIQGQELLPQESRASLYFLKRDLVDFFKPEFINAYVVKNINTITKTDFVRMLALLFQYAQDGDSGKIARGYKPKMEKYYEEFIYTMVGEKQAPLFKPFRAIFTDGNYATRFEALKQTAVALEIPKEVNSIIDIDMYFLGLIYAVVFKSKTIDVTRKDELKAELGRKITSFKSDAYHKKAPGNLKYIKERINSSLSVFNRYANG